MNYIQRYREWMDGAGFDEETKVELAAIMQNEKEIEDRFFTELAFGTGGIRGVMGAGTNRMNIYTVRKATQGLANYILKNTNNGSVAIAYDSRRLSAEFAEEAALVLNGNGIQTYLFDALRPTPELSFAVRELKCTAGIVVTASHNPPEYNGYKVYWSDGGQVPYPRDGEIIAEVNQITDYTSIKVMKKSVAEANGLFHMIGKEIDDTFIAAVLEQTIDRSAISEAGLVVVYTPLHGTGNIPVRRVLREAGFRNVYVVPEQELPDADFPTVGYPNPEDREAFALALSLAKKVGADVAIATDPDADRIGVAAREGDKYTLLSGNMTGALLTEYILSSKKLPRNGAVISTIVSTDMTEKIAKAYGIDYFEVLTGFKYIGEKIKQFEDSGSHEFLFGFEESYGALAGTHARDKDAVVASLLVCEMAAYYKRRGMSLCDGLNELYEKYGFYRESVESITLKGVEGLSNIRKIMSRLRDTPPVVLGNYKVTQIRDYQSGKIKNLVTGKECRTQLPVSNVLYFVFEDESWVCIRPSGTEPKIKVYFGVKAGTLAKADAKLSVLVEAAMKEIMR